MKRFLAALAACGLMAVPTLVHADVPVQAVVSSGCAGATYTAGSIRVVTQDTTGKLCTNATAAIGGNVKAIGPTANGSPAATAPVLVGGTADGTATGNVGNLKVDSSGNAAVNMAQVAGAAPSLTNPLWVANASVTPAAGTAHAIVTGGVAVTLVTGPVKGCYIVNPLTATDEGIATAEPLYVNAITTATTLSTNGSSTALQPGQSFNCIPGQTTNISGNALTSSHAAVVAVW